MSARIAQVTNTASDIAADVESPRRATAVPLCFVVDADASTRRFLSLVLHGTGIDTQEFADASSFRAAVARREPDLVFLNVGLESAEAIECVVALAGRNHSGAVQVMSNRGSAVLAHVRSIGTQHGLKMLLPLKKPFDTGAILNVLHALKIGDPPTVAARIDLEDALRNNWIEFWYQPKIDLRRKQLAGAEACARARHPQMGVLTPSAFMPGASDASLIKLSELGLERSLKAAESFAALGVNLRIAIDIPLGALAKIEVAAIVQAARPKFDKWPGLVIDVPEEQILPELALAADLARRFQPLGVTLAIDDFGRGYSALTRLKELPFTELKLDRAFVVDCGTDKVNAPVCKTVIDLAHNHGSAAVAIGIEKASDALALVAMGCDYGQGFLLGQPMLEERFISLLRQRTASLSRQVPRPGAGDKLRA